MGKRDVYKGQEALDVPRIETADLMPFSCGLKPGPIIPLSTLCFLSAVNFPKHCSELEASVQQPESCRGLLLLVFRSQRESRGDRGSRRGKTRSNFSIKENLNPQLPLF